MGLRRNTRRAGVGVASDPARAGYRCPCVRHAGRGGGGDHGRRPGLARHVQQLHVGSDAVRHGLPRSHAGQRRLARRSSSGIWISMRRITSACEATNTATSAMCRRCGPGRPRPPTADPAACASRAAGSRASGSVLKHRNHSTGDVRRSMWTTAPSPSAYQPMSKSSATTMLRARSQGRLITTPAPPIPVMILPPGPRAAVIAAGSAGASSTRST